VAGKVEQQRILGADTSLGSGERLRDVGARGLQFARTDPGDEQLQVSFSHVRSSAEDLGNRTRIVHRAEQIGEASGFVVIDPHDDRDHAAMARPRCCQHARQERQSA